MSSFEKYTQESYYSTRHKLSFLASFVKINDEAKNVMAKNLLRLKEKEFETKKES